MIKVFVGTTPSYLIPFKVLQYSINKNCSSPVSVFPLNKSMPLETTKRIQNLKQGTPFSFQRFLIPETCNFEGHAFYMDVDQILFSDLNKLVPLLSHGKQIYCRRYFRWIFPTIYHDSSFMLINCSQTKWKLENLLEALESKKCDYRMIMRCLYPKIKIGTLSNKWNSYDRFDTNTHVLHFTNKACQPWLVRGHPFQKIWLQLFFECLDKGVIKLDDVKEAASMKQLRPSLFWQAKEREYTIENSPNNYLKEDLEFQNLCASQDWNLDKGLYREGHHI